MSNFRPQDTGIVEAIAREKYPPNLDNPPPCPQPIRIYGGRYNGPTADVVE